VPNGAKVSGLFNLDFDFSLRYGDINKAQQVWCTVFSIMYPNTRTSPRKWLKRFITLVFFTMYPNIRTPVRKWSKAVDAITITAPPTEQKKICT